jgi:serine/threonine protein kinase
MKKFAVIILFLAVGFGLYFLKKKFNIHSDVKSPDNIILSWEYTPKKIADINTPVEFVFNLKDKNNTPISNAKVEIEANMNHSGMIPLFTEATFIKDSTYKTRFKLTMMGEWILFLTITLPDGQVIKKDVHFSTL